VHCELGLSGSLDLLRIYERVPDPIAEKDGLLRVIDESGEGYLYPARYFTSVEAFQECREDSDH